MAEANDFIAIVMSLLTLAYDEEDVAEEDVAEEDVAEEDVAEEDVAEEDVAEEDVAEEDHVEDAQDGEPTQHLIKRGIWLSRTHLTSLKKHVVR